jgi:phage tail-like protein
MARPDPYSGFRFVVMIDQLQKGGFSKVRGLQRETRVETFREGGVNDREHKLVSLTSYSNLILDRGLADPDLWMWHQEVVEGKVTRRTITVTLRDEQQKDVWGWLVQSAYPVKWAVADFDAASGQVVAESIEFAHHGLLRRPIPFSAGRAA